MEERRLLAVDVVELAEIASFHELDAMATGPDWDDAIERVESGASLDVDATNDRGSFLTWVAADGVHLTRLDRGSITDMVIASVSAPEQITNLRIDANESGEVAVVWTSGDDGDLSLGDNMDVFWVYHDLELGTNSAGSFPLVDTGLPLCPQPPGQTCLDRSFVDMLDVDVNEGTIYVSGTGEYERNVVDNAGFGNKTKVLYSHDATVNVSAGTHTIAPMSDEFLDRDISSDGTIVQLYRVDSDESVLSVELPTGVVRTMSIATETGVRARSVEFVNATEFTTYFSNDDGVIAKNYDASLSLLGTTQFELEKKGVIETAGLGGPALVSIFDVDSSQLQYVDKNGEARAFRIKSFLADLQNSLGANEALEYGDIRAFAISSNEPNVFVTLRDAEGKITIVILDRNTDLRRPYDGNAIVGLSNVDGPVLSFMLPGQDPILQTVELDFGSASSLLDGAGPLLRNATAVYGDFKGADGVDEVAIFFPNTGSWMSIGSDSEISFLTTDDGQWEFGAYRDAMTVDLNNDGYDDIVGRNQFPEEGTTQANWIALVSDGVGGYATQILGSWSSKPVWESVVSGDFNGDGIDDIAGRTDSGRWWVSLVAEPDSVRTRITTPQNPYDEDAVRMDVEAEVGGSLDIDLASSYPEFVWKLYDSERQFVVRVVNGDLQVDELLPTRFQQTSYWGKWSSDVVWFDVLVGDFDQDGDDDIAGRARSRGAWWVANSNAGAFDNQLWGRWSTDQAWSGVSVGDFNGDGKVDIAGLASNGTWIVGLSDGTRFDNQVWARWTSTEWLDLFVVDAERDGRNDIIGRTPDNAWWLASSTGAAFDTVFAGRWDNRDDDGEKIEYSLVAPLRANASSPAFDLGDLI